MSDQSQLLAHLFNGFGVHVTGHEKSIDVLKDLLIPNKSVKSISTYKGEGYGPHLEKLEQLNYTKLRELRETP